MRLPDVSQLVLVKKVLVTTFLPSRPKTLGTILWPREAVYIEMLVL